MVFICFLLMPLLGYPHFAFSGFNSAPISKKKEGQAGGEGEGRGMRHWFSVGRRAMVRDGPLLPWRGAVDAPRKPEAAPCSSPRVITALLRIPLVRIGVAFVSPAARWQHPAPSPAPPKALQVVCCHSWDS